MKEKDMHLPVWVCGLGIIFLVAAVVCMAIISISPLICITAAVICLCLGISAVLCWRNQWAEVIDDDEFIYSTMFGNKNKYRFSEITDIRQNSDSMTLFLGKNKIHIESCAIISDRFANLVNQALGNDDN